MKDNLDVTEFGVIAQEMKEVLPDLVTVIDNETGYYGVNYMGLIPWTVLGIKELDQQYEQNLEMLTVMDGRLKLIEERVSENERKIASLQDENAELKKRVEKLEAMMLKILEEKK
jgi:hypothetical protein